MNSSDIFSDYMSKLWVKDRFVEPYKPNHNPTERKAMGTKKEKLGRLMIDAGCEKWHGLEHHYMFQMSTIIPHLIN